MNIETKKLGIVGAAVGMVGLGVSAIVAECRRRKVKKALLETQIDLACTKLDCGMQELQIKCLEKEIQSLKSED